MEACTVSNGDAGKVGILQRLLEARTLIMTARLCLGT